jgi:hypothetical protein
MASVENLSSLFEEVVSVRLKFESKFGTAGFDDLAVRHDMDDIRLNVIEKTLVVGDEEETTLR